MSGSPIFYARRYAFFSTVAGCFGQIASKREYERLKLKGKLHAVIVVQLQHKHEQQQLGREQRQRRSNCVAHRLHHVQLVTSMNNDDISEAKSLTHDVSAARRKPTSACRCVGAHAIYEKHFCILQQQAGVL